VSLQSNEWTGKFSFRGQNLHTVSSVPNPYEQAITIIGKTLEVFDDDKL
jgi:E3 ubiquitin-protein ligase RGLG